MNKTRARLYTTGTVKTNEEDMSTEAHSKYLVQLKVNGVQTDLQKYAARVVPKVDGEVVSPQP